MADLGPSTARADDAPLHHVRRMSARLDELIDHLRADIERVDEPRFRAMFETAAEVLGGVVTAFRHYEQGREEAWRGR